MSIRKLEEIGGYLDQQTSLDVVPVSVSRSRVVLDFPKYRMVAGSVSPTVHLSSPCAVKLGGCYSTYLTIDCRLP